MNETSALRNEIKYLEKSLIKHKQQLLKSLLSDFKLSKDTLIKINSQPDKLYILTDYYLEFVDDCGEYLLKLLLCDFDSINNIINHQDNLKVTIYTPLHFNSHFIIIDKHTI